MIMKLLIYTNFVGVLKYGRGSYHATQQPLEDVCRDLHCRREFFTWTSHPALDGTRCSANDDMVSGIHLRSIEV